MEESSVVRDAQALHIPVKERVGKNGPSCPVPFYKLPFDTDQSWHGFLKRPITVGTSLARTLLKTSEFCNFFFL